MVACRPHLGAAPVPDGLDDAVISQRHRELVSISRDDVHQTCRQVRGLEHLMRTKTGNCLKMRF